MRQVSPVGGSTLMTSAPKSDRITAAPGPAMKLARSTTFSPEKMLSLVMGCNFLNCRERRVFFTDRGIVVIAFGGRQLSLPSCPQLRRKARNRQLRAAGLRFG